MYHVLGGFKQICEDIHESNEQVIIQIFHHRKEGAPPIRHGLQYGAMYGNYSLFTLRKACYWADFRFHYDKSHCWDESTS